MTETNGDITIHLRDKDGQARDLQLRPSLGFIRTLDQRGIKLIALLKRFRENDYGLTEMGAVISAASAEKVTPEEAEELIYYTGAATAEVVLPIVRLIGNALNGGRSANPNGAEASDPTPKK